MLAVAAQSAYPSSVASRRVRLDNHAARLRTLGVRLDLDSPLDESGYAPLARRRDLVSKARVGISTARGLARMHAASRDASLLMVHRLRSLVPVPGVDPPRRVDVYDFDDALFAAPRRRLHDRLKREPERFDVYLGSARLVIAGNEYLADRACKIAAKVEVIPSCIEVLAETPPPARLEAQTLGWIGSPTTTPYVEALIPKLAPLRSRFPELRLILVGAQPQRKLPDWVDVRTWSPASEATALAEMDVGLMPLPDDPWSRGKCGYKLLQYAAAGVPSVGDPVGVNRRILDGIGGVAPLKARTWPSEISELLLDRQARDEIATRGHKFVDREFSYRRWTPELATLLRDLAG